MKELLIRGCVLTLMLIFAPLTSSAEWVREPIPLTPDLLCKIMPKTRLLQGTHVYQDDLTAAIEQPGKLCSPNAEIGYDLVTYEECCKEDDNGACIARRSCRKAVATCSDLDGEGWFESHGLPECEACLDIPIEEPEDYTAPFCY